MGWEHYQTVDSHKREPQAGGGLFGVHLVILHFKFQFSKSIKSSTFHIFLNSTFFIFIHSFLIHTYFDLFLTYPLFNLSFKEKISFPIRFFHQSHNTVHFGGLFTLKQWIFSSLKHDPVPRENKLYCFYVKNPPKRIALWDRENSQYAHWSIR